ncbi:hypothetical protein K9M48_02985 [Candidatus Gracilibacteria bacterium]|nr:hypothetical protein [Candidatus Gracilibacteria bacterium]
MFNVIADNIPYFDFTSSGGVKDFFVILVSFFIFLWVVCIIWVGKDIASRTNNVVIQVLSIILITLFSPLIGLPLYIIIRPVSYKKDNIPWREACALNLISCYNCDTFNPKEYECCIKCGEKLRIKCKQCGELYPHSYIYCNKCGAPNIELDL